MPKSLGKGNYVKRYSEEDLQMAIKDVQNGMPKREACKKHKIPRATLQFRLSGKFVKTSHGPPPVLTTEEEDMIVNWVKECHRKGFPQRKDAIQCSVKQFLDENPRDNPFTNNYPGIGWYKAFLKRHPELTVRKPEPVTPASSRVSESDIRKWFQDIYTYLEEKKFHYILNDPNRVFNGDETNFLLCPQNKKVLAPKGVRNVYEVDCGVAKSALTVMFTFSASGLTVPPLIIYPYIRVPKEIGDSVPKDFAFTNTESGWMKKEIFYEYIANTFYKHLKKLNVDFPVILFVDGHATHLDRRLSDICTQLQIILIALYPNATRILQPADVSTFKPLKDGWKRGVLEWRRNHPTEELTKKHFAPILKMVIDKTVRPDIITNGFRACGLYPWNPNAIDYTKCLGGNHRANLKEDIPIQYLNEVDNKQDSSYISFSKFKEIVGEDRIQQFESLPEGEDNSALFKLFLEFKKQPQTSNEAMYYVVTENGHLQEEKDFQAIEHNEVLTLQNEIKISPFRSSTNCVENDKIFEPSDIINAPIMLVNSEQEDLETSKEIKEYLYWPKTPIRKGTKTSEKAPFIITSSSWKELKDKKEAAQKEKEDQKENKKLERERKKIEKEKEDEIKRKRKEEKKVRNMKKRGNIKIISDIVLNSPQTPEQKQLPEKFFNVSKNLFNTEFKQLEQQTTAPKILFKNKNIFSGLCFSCTMNLTKENFGIKCDQCLRIYHQKCIEKHNLHKSNSDIFTCNPCLNKLNNMLLDKI